MVKLVLSILEEDLWPHRRKRPEGLVQIAEDLYLYWLRRWHSPGTSNEGAPLRRLHKFPLLAWNPPKQGHERLDHPTKDLEQVYKWLYQVRIEMDWARMVVDLAGRRERRKRELSKLAYSQVKELCPQIGEDNLSSSKKKSKS